MKECTYSLGDDYYVIGFEKSNTALRDKVNDAIKAVIGTAGKRLRSAANGSVKTS